MPRLSESGKQNLRAYLADVGQRLPGVFAAVGTADEVLFCERDGLLDMLDPSAGKPDAETIYWFASTTKLITAVCALQLIDAGVLEPSTPMSRFFPQFATPYKIVRSIGKDGVPVFEESNEEITVATLMNQTSGFGLEMGECVQGWKKWSTHGNGYTNSCLKENLIHVPPTELPGRRFEYGNGSEWLGLLIQEATGKDLDQVFREQIFDPLGMKSTTFYPFSDEQRKHLFSLRWLERKETGEIEWQEFGKQLDLLKLPRDRSKMDYPVAGGGIYTAPHDYLTLLRHLLSCRLSSSGSSTLSLSADAIASLFINTLPDTELGHSGMLWAEKYGASPRELGWSTGLCVFDFENKPGQQRPLKNGGRGRTTGSCGWAGAAGTEYWMDPSKGIAVVCTTQLLPTSDPAVEEFKQEVERLVYEALEE
ncbi:hypothetical protein JCM10207_000530 [Rhodosporidiobolus poonsookiae]